MNVLDAKVARIWLDESWKMLIYLHGKVRWVGTYLKSYGT